jgi:hypothetical protein
MTARPPRIARTVPKGQRKPNLRRADEHRTWIKLLPCLGCGRRPPCDPAHLRFSTADEPLKPGTGLKPPDHRIVPLCRTCHDTEERFGKLTFWGVCMSQGISDPIGVAERLMRISGDTERGFAAIQHARPGLPTAWLQSDGQDKRLD